jgi:hypothetical protein
MQIITPVTFTTGMLISSTATEAYPAWVSGTNYSAGNTVWYTDGIYQALANHSNNVPPPTDLAHWLKISPSNHYACFDRQSGNATTATTSLSFTVNAGNFDSIALIGMTGADTISIQVRNGLGGPILWEKDSNLDSDNILSWWQYFTISPDTKLAQYIYSDIPSNANAYITFTVTGTMLSLGEFVFGYKKTLGLTQYGVRAGIVDYSKKTTDDFGNTTLVKRSYSKKLTCDVMVENANINKTQNLLYSLRAEPVVWIASPLDIYSEPLIVYGFYKDFSTTISYPSYAMCSIEVESLA